MHRMRTGLACLAAGLLCSARMDPAEASVRRSAVVEAVEQVVPSVVNIGTERLVRMLHGDPARRFRGDVFDSFFRDFFGHQPQAGYEVAHSLGSGVIIDPHGYILTNYHVIERASAVRVTLADERSFAARFVAADEVSDLALIQVDAGHPLPAVRFARPGDLMLGETVIALGNPFGLAHSVTVGVLSATDREARQGGQVLFRDILQTDAAVNPGSSGGPLVNVDGELIGINVAIHREAQNIGFAVPVGRAREMLARWLDPAVLNRLHPGLVLEDTERGPVVQSVDLAGPAQRGGVRAGDRVLAVNGRAVEDRLGFFRALVAARAGDRVSMLLDRAGDGIEVGFALASLPRLSGIELARERLGVALAAPAAGRARLRRGMLITEVVEGGGGAVAGIRAGLILLRINDVEVSDASDAVTALDSVRPGDTVRLVVAQVEEQEGFTMVQTAAVAVRAH